ncbi:MAG TPA: hypothetical protein VKC56_00735 [Gallionellaceae bacterium]|nr:hypothetical protein [Gallionellaceae bacterium]
MTPPLYITRKTRRSDPAGPAITLREWLAYLDADPEMHPVGFAEVETPDGSRYPVSTGLAVWLGYSQHRHGDLAWFDLVNGHITVSTPNPEIIRKMQRIAGALEARVEGEHGERYDADGREVAA